MGKKERLKFREKWKTTWSIEKKMQTVILAVIIGMTVIAICVSIIFSIDTLTEQSQEYSAERLQTMAAEYDSNLRQYKSVMTSIVLDESVQQYCENIRQEETNALAGNVYSTLQNMMNIQVNVNFIAIINENTQQYVYNGNVSLSESNFETIYQEDYQDSSKAEGADNIVFSFSNNYYRGKRYTLTVYFPVYSTSHVGVRNGMIVMNLDDNMLTQLYSNRGASYSQIYLTDTEGVILSGASLAEESLSASYRDILQGDSGSVHKNGKIINYHKVGNWGYYLVYEIPYSYLFRDSVGIVGVLLTSMLIVMVIALTVSRKITGKLYEPINNIVQKMNDVSKGDLRTRFESEPVDSDSQKLQEGFNIMMDEIDTLINQIKEEQEQMKRIELNSLQSQIQPHFLYNTLECIHWQAASDGNIEISTMVKALAQYYRICLSQGNDIIPIERELEHIKNYLIIQNMRYGDIIELNIDVPEQYRQVKIPKLTLQPLVENSIYHGIKVKEGRKGNIKIFTEQEGKDFFLIVCDNGEGMSEERVNYLNQQISEFDKNIGYGINNVNKRIELMFGKEYGLTFYRNPEAGIRVKIRLPDSTREGERV